MERGRQGLWWGAILTITLGEASRGAVERYRLRLSVGIAISAMVAIFIGIGLGHRLARCFTPAVMVFMLLWARPPAQGMLGLPFSIHRYQRQNQIGPLWV